MPSDPTNRSPQTETRSEASGKAAGETATRFLPFSGDVFRFLCHPGIACFNQCCAGLRLILTPYDILRLKRRLNLPSDRFLGIYTETALDAESRYPRVRLRMNRDGKQSCPFVTPAGCAVYEDRPGACRLYPLGRASCFTAVRPEAAERFFLVMEPHCRGFREDREWTLEEWLSHEGVAEYNGMNDRWLAIVTSPSPMGKKDLTRKHQMFFMASYNLDRFRTFLFESRFFERFHVDPDRRETLRTDDVELMRFAFEWLRFSLFGEKTMSVSQACALRR